MDGHCWFVLRNARPQCDDTSDVLGVSRLADTAQDRFIHHVWIDACFREQRAHSDAAKLYCVQCCQGRACAGKGGADTINDDKSFHEVKFGV